MLVVGGELPARHVGTRTHVACIPLHHPSPHPCQVRILKAYTSLYAAVIDKRVAMKIGPADWSPNRESHDFEVKDWKLLTSGPQYAVWEAVF